MTTYDETREIAIIWSVDDVREDRPDLSDAQAMEVLKQVLDGHNAEAGVCWGTIQDVADHLFPVAKTSEWCPHCDDEVMIPAHWKSECPSCDAPITPCSACPYTTCRGDECPFTAADGRNKPCAGCGRILPVGLFAGDSATCLYCVHDTEWRF